MILYPAKQEKQIKMKMMNEGRVAALFVFFVVFCLYGLCVLTPVQVDAHAGDAPDVCCLFVFAATSVS